MCYKWQNKTNIIMRNLLFFLKLTLACPLSALMRQTWSPRFQGSWRVAVWLVNACLKQLLWGLLLLHQVWLQSPWRGPQQGRVRAEVGAGKDLELEAAVWPLKQGERLMARVWLHWVVRLHWWQEGWRLPGSWESLSCLHLPGAKKERRIRIKSTGEM